MSEASVEHIGTDSSCLWRALFLVVGVFLFLLLAPKSAHADGLLDPVTGTIDQVTSTTDQNVDTASTTVDDVIQTVDTTVDQAAGSVDQTLDATVGTVGGIVSTAGDTVTGVEQAVADQVQTQVTAVPTGSVSPSDAGVLSPSRRPAPLHPDSPAHHQTSTLISVAAIRTTMPVVPLPAGDGTAILTSNPSQLPAAPDQAAGAATPPGDGSRDPGGRGPTQLVAILVAALVLARASSRWLRLFALARAPDPFIPILVSPG